MILRADARSLPLADGCQYYLDTLSETELELLAQGIVPDRIRQSAIHLLKPVTRTDDGQTTFVYHEDDEDLSRMDYSDPLGLETPRPQER